MVAGKNTPRNNEVKKPTGRPDRTAKTPGSGPRQLAEVIDMLQTTRAPLSSLLALALIKQTVR